MFCAWCKRGMGYVHGHAACLHNDCPMYGVNQAECCSGDMACVATSVAGSRAPGHAPAPSRADDER